MNMENIIETANLKKYYHRGSETVRALDGVDIRIKAGEIVSIVGPSGSGKTTLMNLIGCLDSPTEGTLKISGEDITGLKESQLISIRRENIGFIFQQFHLIPTLTVRENVELPIIFARKATDQDKFNKLLNKVGLNGKENIQANMLSAGNKQMVSIARALVNDPKIIIADEPTGKLETKEGDIVMDIFRQLAESGLAVAIATHDLTIADRSDRIIQLQDGKVVQQ
jgi:ABC-type lipoprotein export system ATPase subunit